MRAQTPARFTRQQQIEVATADETFSTTLAIGNGIKLENSKVALASLEPAKAFGFSAFGPLKFRPVVNGVAGDWQALATLVRLPVLKRSEEHTSELQSLMRISYAVLCLKKK